eukprot:TRINITY_DN102219_c0_g1_i1.p1 TRINITY_DN102219_c0_g1~~TRINITY_DN102219_c0_g1_i1.p1  ORF type:complete len:160 (+),score=23.22 TRINITY_DN102219_c0_g1_i1:74-481(+)
MTAGSCAGNSQGENRSSDAFDKIVNGIKKGLELAKDMKALPLPSGISKKDVNSIEADCWMEICTLIAMEQLPRIEAIRSSHRLATCMPNLLSAVLWLPILFPKRYFYYLGPEGEVCIVPVALLDELRRRRAAQAQ